MASVMLLDGNSLVYRAFFALPADMATASGQVTNAVFGFTSMLQYMLNEHQPDLLCVTFDRPEPSFRHAMIPDYKAGRAETPDILRQQMGLVRQVVSVLDLPMVEIVGYEADDVLATLATQGYARGDDVIVVTGDRDSYQLVQDNAGEGTGSIRVLYNKRGVSDYALYDEAGIQERTGVHPTIYAQYAAMRGDPSDNLPGVPGVGEKTAAKLINDYGDIDGIYANLDKLTPKLKENMRTFEAQVRQNATATPLVRDVPDVTIEAVHPPVPNIADALELFKSLEFRALSNRILDAFAKTWGTSLTGEASGSAPTERLTVSLQGALDLTGISEVALVGRWRGPEGRSALEGIAIAHGEKAWWIPSGELRGAVTQLEKIQRIHAHKTKELLRSLHDHGVELLVQSQDTVGLDTAIAGYLLDPAETTYALEELAAKYAGVDLRAEDAAPEGQLDFDGTGEDPVQIAARQAVAVWALVEPMRKAMEARNLTALYDQIERPLISVLARMEIAGVGVDSLYLKELAQELAEEANKAEAEVHEAAGEVFVVNSVLQLRKILFEKLGLKTEKKTKTGYSTDAQSLEKLRGEHAIIEPLLRYREMEKLRSTYGESLIAEVAADGRIHASFNQTVARTGRLSSDQPNLHNIPIRSEEGRRFRRAFIPGDGRSFLVADYNQIELRVIAHLAQDPGLMFAFTSGSDVHTETAKRVFKVEATEVTLAMRSKAKMVSYGLAYGMESYGLAQRLNVPVSEAQQILDSYFEAFPNVHDYMDRAVAEARNKGYTETLFGRRRNIPELQSPNYRIRQMGERQAMNAGIQGLAADIFKVALVRLDHAMIAAGHQSRVILQVHDEIVVEVVPEERDVVGALTIDTMKSAAILDVPLEVNVAWGANWGEAKA
jgi:DNA polymerase I